MMTKSDGTVSCMITLDPTPCKTIAQVCASSTSASPQYKSSLLSGCYEECTLEDIVEDLKDPFGTKKCTACPSSSSCATGEELGTLSDGSKKCFKTVCGKSPDILLLGVGTYATLENGNRVIVTCASGYKRISDSNGCFRCSIPISGGGSSGGTLVTTCPTGTYESGPACQNCSNGYVLSGKYGTLSCYRCCTAEENSVAGACMHCLK